MRKLLGFRSISPKTPPLPLLPLLENSVEEISPVLPLQIFDDKRQERNQALNVSGCIRQPGNPALFVGICSVGTLVKENSIPGYRWEGGG